jgi:hypothetical protein
MEQFIGKDGTKLFLVSDAEFNDLLEDYLSSVPESEWPKYLRDQKQTIFKLTGLGYFPNGMTTPDNLIYIRYKYRGDTELLAHEYGHVLGLDHTEKASIMNAVTHMRFFDPHDLERKAEANFPELWRKYVVPREAYQNIVVSGIAAMALWAFII